MKTISMMSRLTAVALLGGAISFASVVWADDVVPALSEDLEAFDQLLSRGQAAENAKVNGNAAAARAKKKGSASGEESGEEGAAGAADFGKFVSEEARKLKDASPEERKQFGADISEQARSRFKPDGEAGKGRSDVIRDLLPRARQPGKRNTDDDSAGSGRPFIRR